MHEVLVNRLGGLSLPRKSVVRLTDRPDMTLDVYRGRKTTIQYNTALPGHFTRAILTTNHHLKLKKSSSSDWPIIAKPLVYQVVSEHISDHMVISECIIVFV